MLPGISSPFCPSFCSTTSIEFVTILLITHLVLLRYVLSGAAGLCGSAVAAHPGPGAEQHLDLTPEARQRPSGFCPASGGVPAAEIHTPASPKSRDGANRSRSALRSDPARVPPSS